MSDKLHQTDTSRTFPIRWPVAHRDDRQARIIEITDDAATEVFEALSSETARALLSYLHDDPQTVSDLAEQVDTSVQNVQYHLQKFSNAGLVEVVDTWYSARGTEMKVYSPTDLSLVLYAGETPGRKQLREALSRVAGAIAILGIVSVIVDYLARAPNETRPESRPEPDPTVIEIAGTAVTPGVIFFLGGLLVLVLGVGWWYRRR